VPASGSRAPSVAFGDTPPPQLPLGPPCGGISVTTLVQASQLRPRAKFALATDRSVVSPRFAPGLSTTHGGVPTGDPDVSPGQTFPGRLSQLSLGHVMSSGYLLPPWRARADGHTGYPLRRRWGSLVFDP
jgi:hypothetical protein